MNELEDVNKNDSETDKAVTEKLHQSPDDMSDTTSSGSSSTSPFNYSRVKYKKDEDSKVFLVKSDDKSTSKSSRVSTRRGYTTSRGKNRKCKPSKPVSLLRNSLEKRVEGVEKILGDRVDNFLEETSEKYPCLHRIESWIADRKCKSSRRRRNVGRRGSPPSTGNNGNIQVKKERILEEVNCEEDDGHDSLQATRESLESPGECGKSSSGNDPSERKYEARDSPNLVDRVRDGVKEKVDDIIRYFQRTNRLADVNRRLKSQIWSSVVTIVLVEAKNLIPMDMDGSSDPYVKFRLGTEKYKSKVVNKTINPVWLEQFDLHLYEDPYLGQELEVTVWDRDKGHQDDLMGRTTIDLAGLERETTHRIWRDLEDGAGNIFLLLTISGTTASETISDLAAQEDNPKEKERLFQKYSIWNSLQRPRDVGHLTVKVYRAQGLAAADLGGKSDPFCVLELVNSRLQTQTEYKTLAPNWQKIFTFNVKDINSVLEITVYDEDRDHKVEFLGKIAVPLLRIRNGEKRWYALKDKKLRCRAKGNSPQILLEMTVVWNYLRGCVRTLNPREQKYMEPEVKFKRQLFLRNVLRLKAVIMFFIDLGKYIQSCWEWESKTRSIVALVLFVLGCYYFEPWMIPAAALLIILKYCLVSLLTADAKSLSYHSVSSYQDGDVNSDDCPPTPGDDDEDEDDKDKEEKKSLKERLQAIQEVTQTVQNSIGYIASLCEKVKNLFNFTVPYLSYLAMVLAVMGVVVLYCVPVRYLILMWGVNKFFRKILRPHSVPNNEVLDLISSVPDDEDLLSYRELKPMPTADCERGASSSPSTSAAGRREQRKKHKGA
ncbi:multiple C2 and transmembrane domain-containing protein 1 isoform X2 [Fopius arisanus]|uniref:Multiple C2 and transmembrane domain-containing protein 1 isoform X2 n=1 Tax=Fopius arisanus TaxID=64838 RepID=A0A9R1U9P2_9HYME|nr:PREDICTED: multiple C2 and transmembrane domain-containing protein 1 isoform X2 [Fopius arisanus]